MVTGHIQISDLQKKSSGDYHQEEPHEYQHQQRSDSAMSVCVGREILLLSVTHGCVTQCYLPASSSWPFRLRQLRLWEKQLFSVLEQPSIPF